jgi:hypothetical protein
MAHFAKILNGIVQTVIVAEQDFFETFIDSTPGEWIQTSYNTKGGIYYDTNTGFPSNGVALRGNYAGIGYTYDKENDVFYPPKPYPSWIISAPNWTWEAPIPMPNDGNNYKWNEQTLSWVEFVE